MYYGARYHSPYLRQFTQPDSIIQSIYNPQNLNRYTYTLNNPIKYVDPSGNIVFFAAVTVAAIYGGYKAFSNWDDISSRKGGWDTAKKAAQLGGGTFLAGAETASGIKVVKTYGKVAGAIAKYPITLGYRTGRNLITGEDAWTLATDGATAFTDVTGGALISSMVTSQLNLPSGVSEGVDIMSEQLMHGLSMKFLNEVHDYFHNQQKQGSFENQNVNWINNFETQSVTSSQSHFVSIYKPAYLGGTRVIKSGTDEEDSSTTT